MDKLEQNKYMGFYSYLIPASQHFGFFARASMGVIDSEIASDFACGQVGAIYQFNDNWSSEMSYRYLYQDYDEKAVKIDNSQQLMLSVDYLFAALAVA